jgi:hypothetical protein
MVVFRVDLILPWERILAAPGKGQNEASGGELIGQADEAGEGEAEGAGGSRAASHVSSPSQFLAGELSSPLRAVPFRTPPLARF